MKRLNQISKLLLYSGIGITSVAIVKFDENNLTFESNKKSLSFLIIGLLFFGLYLYQKVMYKKED